MSVNDGSATPPPRIGKIGPYTVFLTPPTTSPNPESLDRPSPVKIPVESTPVYKPVKLPSPPLVMAPPSQLRKERPSSFAFFWDAVAKVQNVHARLDERISHWFGLDQSKYQWALDNYYQTNENSSNQTDAKTQAKSNKLQNV